MGSGLLKKTISFESPFASIQEASYSQNDANEEDIFFSPETLPVRSFICSSEKFPVSCHGRTVSEGSLTHMVQNQNTHQTSKLKNYILNQMLQINKIYSRY